jgi:hypothetical protein
MLEGRINDLFERVAMGAEELKEKFMKDVIDKYVLVFARDNNVFFGQPYAMDGNNSLHFFGTVIQLSPEFHSVMPLPEYVIPGNVIEEVYVMKQLKTQVIDAEKASTPALLPPQTPETI